MNLFCLIFAILWAVITISYLIAGDQSAARESALLSLAFVILGEIRSR